MNKRSSRKRNLALSAAAVAAVFSVRPALIDAATFYWDTNGATTGQGSTVTPASWLTFNNWATVAGGLGATSTWANANPNSNTALFPTITLALATVVVNGTVFVNSIEFDTGSYTVAATGNNYVNLSGSNPTINVNLTGTATVNFAAPLTGSNGLTVTGAASGTHVLYLNNADPTNVNNFTGGVTITSTGFLRLGGGPTAEEIPDSNDLNVAGILDFNTGGNPPVSDGKQEKVHNVTVSGGSSNFSVGNGSNFIMNSATISSTGTSQGISLNGNNTALGVNPSRLTINGWDGGGSLTLNDGTLKMNSSGAPGAATGGSVVSLSGDLVSTGNSVIYNVNGTLGTVATNVFPYQNFVFTSSAHNINVSGVLLMSSNAANHPLEIQSSAVGGTTLTKTGPGELILANAAETTFTGTTRISQGTLTLGAAERLADASTLNIAGGTFNMQGFNETVGSVVLDSGTIVGSGGVLTSAQGFALKSGSVSATLAGAGDLVKSTTSQVTLMSPNTYTGQTRVQGGTLLISSTLGTGTLAVTGGQAKFAPGAPTSTVKGLSIGSSGSIDLSYNSMVIDYPGGGFGSGSLALLRSYIAAGSLNSSSAGTVLGLNFRLGYRDNQDTGPGLTTVASFGGVPVDPSSVLIGLTMAGDTNLDGRVDVADLYNMAAHYNQPGNWEQGDINYDGVVNVADLKLLAATWVWPSGSGLAPALGPLLTSLGLPDVSAPASVPEPATFALGAMGCACLMTRKRRLQSNGTTR